MSQTSNPAFAAVTLSSGVTLSGDTVSTLVSVIDADSRLQKRWLAASDALRAEGVTSDLLRSNKEARDAFKVGVILLSFTKTEQSIMAKPVHACTDPERVTRRWVQQQTGAKFARVVSYLIKAEKAEEMTDDERGAKARASIGTRLRKDLTAWIDRIEKAEAVDFSAVEMIKALKSAIVLIK